MKYYRSYDIISKRFIKLPEAALKNPKVKMHDSISSCIVQRDYKWFNEGDLFTERKSERGGYNSSNFERFEVKFGDESSHQHK